MFSPVLCFMPGSQLCLASLHHATAEDDRVGAFLMSTKTGVMCVHPCTGVGQRGADRALGGQNRPPAE